MKAIEAVNLLNQLLKEQPDFAKEITTTRHVLSDSFMKSDLPFVAGVAKDGSIHMSAIGLMNGIVSDGKIAASFDDEMNLVEFMVVACQQ